MSEEAKTLDDLKDLVSEGAIDASAEAAPREPQIDDLGRAYATGKRKDAVARVWVKAGSGKVTVNGRELEIVGIYFCGSLLLDSAIVADADVIREISLFDENTLSSFYVEPTGEVRAHGLRPFLEGTQRFRDPGSRCTQDPGGIGTDVLPRRGHRATFV